MYRFVAFLTVVLVLVINIGCQPAPTSVPSTSTTTKTPAVTSSDTKKDIDNTQEVANQEGNAEPGTNEAQPSGQVGLAVDEDSDGADASAGEHAVFRGKVVLEGDAPAPRKITVTKDTAYCSKTVKDYQEVVVSKDGGIANVVVYVKGIEAPADGWKWTEPKDGYTFRQKGCMFTPSLMVIPVGAKITVHNDDEVAHNVNTGEWNLLQPAKGDPISQPLLSKRPSRVTCNIHSWMEAWTFPVESPHYAVTDEEGKFEIKDIPPGKYTISIWHATLRPQRLRETFEAGQTLEKSLTFKANE